MTHDGAKSPAPRGQSLKVFAAWTLVGVPFLWGVLQTIAKAALLFR